MSVELLQSEPVFQGRAFSVRRDRVRFPNGHTSHLEIIDHPRSVTLVPLDPQGDLLFVRQYRHAAGEELLELPAGTLDPGEEPEACAVRECREEIGMAPGRLTLLASCYLVPGYSTEFMDFYLAEELTASPLMPDQDELLERVCLSPGEAERMAQRGEIRDAKTLVGLYLALHRPRG